MEPFSIVEGAAAVMPDANISTDAIIPSVWAVKPGVNLGEKLFANLRYDADGVERRDFVLNMPPFRDAKILIAGANFGCGSSRESAVWAIKRFGIRSVIAPSFGEIFQENMFKNGLLPIALNSAKLDELRQALTASSTGRATVDLKACTIAVNDRELGFEISTARRSALLEGLEDFDIVQRSIGEIDDYERLDGRSRPWNSIFIARAPHSKPL
jgi:3-isopropylmalate/(R)-2-methylmalate dehydratase small subunit